MVYFNKIQMALISLMYSLLYFWKVFYNQVFTLAESLGGAESLIEVPYVVNYSNYLIHKIIIHVNARDKPFRYHSIIQETKELAKSRTSFIDIFAHYHTIFVNNLIHNLEKDR